MKGYSTFLLIATIMLSLLYGAQSSDQEMTGPEIIRKVNDLINPASSYAKAKMTIVTSSGQTRTFIYDSWSNNYGEKNLIRYLEPARTRGQATLMLNHADDIWMYFPRTKRVRKLATHAKKQKMEGSDFSYEDMGSGNAFIDDFITKRLEDEKKEDQPCYRLEMNRKDGTDISYSRLLMWVRQDNFVPIVIDYYDEDDPGKLLKELVQQDIRIIQDIPTAMKMIMFNRQDNTKTEMEFLEVQYNISLGDGMFTERGLKK